MHVQLTAILNDSARIAAHVATTSRSPLSRRPIGRRGTRTPRRYYSRVHVSQKAQKDAGRRETASFGLVRKEETTAHTTRRRSLSFLKLRRSPTCARVRSLTKVDRRLRGRQRTRTIPRVPRPWLRRQPWYISEFVGTIERPFDEFQNISRSTISVLEQNHLYSRLVKDGTSFAILENGGL